MTITQTVEITDNRRITIPREVPTGATIITFTPAPKGAVSSAKKKYSEEEEREYINLNAERLNKEMEDFLSYQNWFGESESSMVTGTALD
jgi:hypothetical protein